jgi:hypothetical protein
MQSQVSHPLSKNPHAGVAPQHSVDYLSDFIAA